MLASSPFPLTKLLFPGESSGTQDVVQHGVGIQSKALGNGPYALRPARENESWWPAS
jgi:hypothetical protein